MILITSSIKLCTLTIFDRYELNCTSRGDPSPTLFLTLPDGRTVITPPSEDLAKLHPRTPQIVSKKGHVTCEARNSEGRQVNDADLPRPRKKIVLNDGVNMDTQCSVCVDSLAFWSESLCQNLIGFIYRFTVHMDECLLQV